MDFAFHLQQGQQLLGKRDSTSIKKALEHFKKANIITEDEHISKPLILYYLAYGNFAIGQIVQAYKIAYKAKRRIEIAIANNGIAKDNIRQIVGQDMIDTLINHLEKLFEQTAFSIDTDNDDFDENYFDFSLVNQLFQTIEKEEIKPQFSINSLNEEVLMATFFSLSISQDETYFDKLKGDVVSYVEGYFSSHIGNQIEENRRLSDRITNGEPIDLFDEDRYILINRLKLSEFLNEYKKQTQGKEPFNSYVEIFSVEILKDYTHDEYFTIDNLDQSFQIQEKFHALFKQKYHDRDMELKYEYGEIFKRTAKVLAINWIKKHVPNIISNDDTENSDFKLDFVFQSSDHIRYENGKHVSGPHGGARRSVKVEPNINNDEGVTATIYNLDGIHPIWQNNIQMAPKRMKVIKQTTDKIILRGYGQDMMGGSFADYGLTIKLKNGELENCILHLYDRGVDIEYLA